MLKEYYPLFINGKWEDSSNGEVFETHNPATGEVLAKVAKATKAMWTKRWRRPGRHSRTASGPNFLRPDAHEC